MHHNLSHLLPLPERSYKKSKKHKKKTKKRRHKSVSTQEVLWKTGVFGASADPGSDKQASPDSDNEKKGRERDGKREKDLEKEKENDSKSRGKSRSDSKQKSPKRKAAKEEVGCLEDRGRLNLHVSLHLLKSALFLIFVLPSGRLGYVRQRAERRGAREEEEDFTGTAGRSVMTVPPRTLPPSPSAQAAHTTLKGQITHLWTFDRCATLSPHTSMLMTRLFG